jgi:glycosyltransferase involved in cell wall biosynthesis
MKVCHITSAHPPFDVRIFHKECRSLAQAGYEVTLIAPANFKERVVEGVHVLGITRPIHRWQRVQAWREILVAVRHLKPDVVHFHDPDLLLLAPFLDCRRLIYDCHERNAVAMLNKPWLPKLFRHPAYRLVSFLEPVLARRTTAVVLVDESQVETFQKIGKPLIMVKNFPIIEKSVTNQSDYYAKAVVHVGAHARSRGCGVMIEAFRLVAEQIPDAELWLVGPFNHHPYEEETRGLIARFDLERVVKLVGQVPYPEALQWISKAAIGIIAYQAVPQYQECLPTKVLEYMAAGLPIVAADVPANRNIIAPADCGFLVEPADRKQYAEAIIHLLTNQNRARQLGDNGRQAVIAAYDWRLAEKNLLAMYTSLLNGQEVLPQTDSTNVTYIAAEKQSGRK